MRCAFLLAAAAAFVLLATRVRADESAGLDELDTRTRRDVVEAARSYFDPDVEFLYTPRKHFVAQLEKLAETGMDGMKDLGLLREIVYSGRSFKQRFSDEKWRDLSDVKEFKKSKGVYLNLKSDDYRFTYTLPKGYPNESGLVRKIPRVAPYPLLLSLHEEQDLVDKRKEAEPYPGGAMLERRYPKGDFGTLYSDWFLLAPVAPRADFLDPDGTVRHRFSTKVLREFWQRYHVDFDRIVADGGPEAAVLVSVFPHVFAGLILRAGEVDPALVPNLGGVPIYVVGDPALKKTLDQAGHPNVTVGDDKGLVPWLSERRREVPTAFSWNVVGPDHLIANWIHVAGAQFGGTSSLGVEVLDTAENPNTIKVDAKGVEEISMFLNDGIVDLDRPVTLLLNGEKRELGKVERNFSQLFERQPKVRSNMYFGWLYTAFVPDVALAPVFDPDLRLEAQHAWLFGHPERLENVLGHDLEALWAAGADLAQQPPPAAATRDALWPFLLRDLWWRPADAARRQRLQAVLDRILVADEGTSTRALAPYRWLEGGGDTPFPAPPQDDDPWPVLSTLILDRQLREREGVEGYPERSPLATRRPPDAWRDWWEDWFPSFQALTQQRAYGGDDSSTWPVDVRADEARLDERARERRRLNLWLAAGGILGFVGLALLLGRRLGPR